MDGAPDSIVNHLRLATARMRATEFERMHHFNINSRIAVKRRNTAAMQAAAAMRAP